MSETTLDLFARAYARHRADEGRAYGEPTIVQLPYLTTGPHAAQWAIRARTYERFMTKVLRPAAARSRHPLNVLDLGAGNGWLSHRIALEGHRATALDIRDDVIDGLGAAMPLARRVPRLQCVVASFEAIPLADGSADITLFNASLHYATDLHAVLEEAKRVTREGGHIAILDSPFYLTEADGFAMVAEKRQRFGARADTLMALPFIEFLSLDRLRRAAPELAWNRHKVRYPLAYELRPLLAAISGKRRPSRFDLWVATRP